MQDCYSEKASFNDPVFQNLNAGEVKNMWEMFCKKGKDLVIDFSNINCGELYGTAQWKADYIFSQTGRKVTNVISSKFWFEDGLIIKHEDDFDFYVWAKQALGIPGFLLGKTNYLKKKVQNSGKKNLESFMKKNF
jgi:hypothetical protein